MYLRHFIVMGMVLVFAVACAQTPFAPISDTHLEGEQEGVVVSDQALSEVVSASVPFVYTLGPNDVLNVRVFNENDLSGQFTLNVNGAITMPLIGEVGLVGLSVQEAEQVITQRYADGYLVSPSVGVEIDSYRPFYIMGEVNTPGEYEYTPGLDVIKAVALAGGFTYRANQQRFKVSAEDSTASDFEVVNSKYKLAPGDVVVVGERFF